MSGREDPGRDDDSRGDGASGDDGDDGAPSDGDDEWTFSVDDVGPDGLADPLEPGSIDPEGALFFIVGVGLAIAVLVAAVP